MILAWDLPKKWDRCSSKSTFASLLQAKQQQTTRNKEKQRETRRNKETQRNKEEKVETKRNTETQPETKKIADYAQVYQTPIAPHDWTGPVNVFACAHISFSSQNVMLQETNRAYYKGWYDKFIEPNINIKDGYILPPNEPGLGTRLSQKMFDRNDLDIRFTTEKSHWNVVGFIDPSQKVLNYFSKK